jgi:hypothetical protein
MRVERVEMEGPNGFAATPPKMMMPLLGVLAPLKKGTFHILCGT